jgi:hypothetical protein
MTVMSIFTSQHRMYCLSVDTWLDFETRKAYSRVRTKKMTSFRLNAYKPSHVGTGANLNRSSYQKTQYSEAFYTHTALNCSMLSSR